MTPNVGEEHPKFTEEEATERTLKKKLEADPSVFNFYVYLRTHPLIQRQNLTNKKLERGSSLDQTKDTAQFEDAVTPLERKLYFSTAHFHLRAGQFFQIPICPQNIDCYSVFVSYFLNLLWSLFYHFFQWSLGFLEIFFNYFDLFIKIVC